MMQHIKNEYQINELSLEEAREELERQDDLLDSVDFVATHLVTAEHENFELALWESLQSIGRAAAADRAYIWQNYEENGVLYCRQTHEWSEGAKPQQGMDFAAYLPYDDIPYWKERVFSDQTINGPIKGLPTSEKELLESQDIVSVLIIPLMQHGNVWGFIGFDDCHMERFFSKAEEAVLQTAGILMSSAIINHVATQKVVNAQTELVEQEKLLRAVNQVAELLIEDNDQLPEDYLVLSLRYLAESVDADRGFIWRNSVIDGVICTTELCEWARDVYSFSDYDEKPVNIPLVSFIPEWKDTLLVGKNLNMFVKDMSEEFRCAPVGAGVLTNMNIPLTVHGEFWGLIGFCDMHRERLYTDTEMDILKSGGMLIASTIMRNEMMENLVDTKEEALASNKAKTEFLSRMSHEIRTPMNAVIGMVTLAQKSNDIERISYCLDRIDSSSKQLLSIINDVLDMSKIESGKFEMYIQPFDFERMIQHCINVVQVKLDEKQQKLNLEMKQGFRRQMVSDELRLSQVLINLLTNAIKFTPEFGVITLRIRENKESVDSTVLHIEVEDTGIGISEEQQKRLFNSFEQADNSITRQFGGSGLGLAICKKITTMLGGDIWVKSQLGNGSTFIFEIQIEWGEALATETEKGIQEHLRVLVVDDSRDARDYFHKIISGFGVVCDEAESGEVAIKMANDANVAGKPYDVAFVDWKMPGIDGEETAEKLLEISDSTAVVIISVADKADVEKGVSAVGIRHFLTKPVLPSVLYNTIVQLTNDTLVHSQSDLQIEMDWSGRHILLVEDIDINREIMAALLDDTEITIDYAENGQEAVELFVDYNGGYDLILMDVQMPVMDGLEATRQIRALDDVPWAKDVPIIAMTANAFKEDVEDCLESGMNDHIAKPIELEELFLKMDQHMR